MTETPGQYNAVLGNNAAPHQHQRLKVTRTITTAIRVNGAAPVDVDEVIDAIALSPGIEVLKISKLYRNRREPGVRRYVDIRTVPEP